MEKLESLIWQLESLEKNLRSQQQIAKQNTLSLLLRMPKIIFIQRVCTFLDDKELYILTASCSTMRRVIFCPLGFKLLFISRNANHILGARPYTQANVHRADKFDLSILGGSDSNSAQLQFEDEDDARAQLMALRQVKEFLSLKLKDSVQNINKLEDVMDDLQTSLKFEKSVNLKLQSKINILQNQLNVSELQRQDAKENLSELNSKYNKIISQKENDNKKVNDEKEQLLAHKKILIEEVYRLRNQVQEMEQQQQGYKDALSQVKIFMDSVEVKPIQHQIQ